MDTSSEAWRILCEIRSVAKMPDDQRRNYYTLVLEKRGREAANQLIEAVNQERRRDSGRLF